MNRISKFGRRKYLYVNTQRSSDSKTSNSHEINETQGNQSTYIKNEKPLNDSKQWNKPQASGSNQWKDNKQWSGKQNQEHRQRQDNKPWAKKKTWNSPPEKTEGKHWNQSKSFNQSGSNFNNSAKHTSTDARYRQQTAVIFNPGAIYCVCNCESELQRDKVSGKWTVRCMDDNCGNQGPLATFGWEAVLVWNACPHSEKSQEFEVPFLDLRGMSLAKSIERVKIELIVSENAKERLHADRYAKTHPRIQLVSARILWLKVALRMYED